MNKKTLIPLLLVLAGALLRFWGLSKNDLWADEAATFVAIQKIPFSFGSAPPLYYILLKAWTSCFGTSELALRFPSALLSLFSIPILYALGKKMFGRHAGLLAAGFMALSPFHLWYAQEARGYALGLFLTLLSSYFLYLYISDGRKKSAASFIIFSALAFYATHYSILLLFSQFVYLALQKRKTTFSLFLFALPALLILPHMRLVWKTLHHISFGFWVPRPDADTILITLENFFLGYHGTTLLYAVSLAVVLTALLVCLYKTARKTPQDHGMTFCLTLSFLPIAAAYSFSLFFTSIYLDRVFIIFSPYVYLFVAGVITAYFTAPAKRLAITALLISAGIASGRFHSGAMHDPHRSQHHMGTFLKKPFRPLAEFLKMNTRDGDHLLFANHAAIHPLYYYSGMDERRFLERACYVYDLSSIDTDKLRPHQRVYKSAFYISTGDFLEKHKAEHLKIFLIGGTFQRDGGLDGNSRLTRDFFDRHLTRLEELDFDGIKVFVYERARESFSPKTSKE